MEAIDSKDITTNREEDHMMNEDQIRRIRDGYYTAFINAQANSSLAYKPEFVSNDYKTGRKVLSVVERELQRCSEFCISVAFITQGGVEPLLQTLKELEQNHIPGKILTTDYLNFSAPAALEKLHSLKNIDVRMYCTGQDDGFHTKGYIFRNGEIYRIIVGSSNMTMAALTRNKEWNSRIISARQGEYAQQLLEEFHELWDSERTQPYEAFIEDYRQAYEISQQQRESAKKASEGSKVFSYGMYTLKPNAMQVEFTKNLMQLRAEGKDRALLISATGTGKTYASAFAMRAEKERRILFLVHREQIAKQALRSYKRVFGSSMTYGLLSGNACEIQADIVFSTIQMMSRDEMLCRFRPDEFSAVIIDEVHKAGAASYQKIMKYFHPELWLGMTATPERTDGYDIYKLFDHNIAYEIRLRQAMEENLLCPFHYFGITDLVIDGKTSRDEPAGKNADSRERLEAFNFLTCDKRVDYILEKADYYGYSGDRVKGLIFVSRKEVGVELSEKFNERGFRTRFLSGADSQQEREQAIECLTTDDPGKEKLDYILTVDIFNEGVDIPEVNQVILLRPTQSPIIFVQQLGRGLRKADRKEFVVILDFIGNYTNNYMIPIALSGDRGYKKDNMRRFVADGTRIIPGSSTIHFDEIARKKIYASIDSANFNDLRLIRDHYQQLRNKLGRIPKLMDFDRYGEMDILHIFEKCGSYYHFLVRYEKEYNERLPEREAEVIEFISGKLADGKRPEELILLKNALEEPDHLFQKDLCLRGSSSSENNALLRESVISVLTNTFPTEVGRKKFADCILIEPNGEGDYRLTPDFVKMLQNTRFRAILEELLDFGINRNKRDYAARYKNTDLVLYQKYTYEDVCHLLNWKRNEVPLNIGGYKYDARTRTFPVFVNYVKDENVAATQRYEDQFTAPEHLTAISKSGRTVESEDLQNFLHCEERNIAVHLFVRKNKDDKISKEFYYLGQMFPDQKMEPEEFVLPGTSKTAVRMYWRLDRPVREDLYEYITEETI